MRELSLCSDPRDRDGWSVAVPREPSSCTECACGTCGTGDHRDVLVTDDEKSAQKTMFVRVSRALTPELTLDVS